MASRLSRKDIALVQKLLAPEWDRIEADLLALADEIPDALPRLSVPEWAEAKRVLVDLTARPGPFRWKNNPPMREIADCFSVRSPVERVAVMKGAQGPGFTTSVLENVIGYYIDVAPGPIMFVSASQAIAEKSVELRIGPMLESAGLAFSPTTQRSHGKKTGDTKDLKEFPGGFLMATGPNAPARLRSFPVQILLFDEVEAYDQDVGENAKKEGDPISLAERRTDTYGGMRKILYGSTPGVKQTSNIEPLFQAGDQRYYYVPCKHCGAMQRLVWKQLKYDVDEMGRLVVGSVRYECEACHGAWRNEDKPVFLAERGYGGSAEWRPTAIASRSNFQSYHISTLYALARPWDEVVQQWLDVKSDTAKLRAFINTVLGETFEERGWAPTPEKVSVRAKGYHVGELPPGAKPLVVTLGADVQADRIEAEIVAWGRGEESWSIDYLVLKGDTSNLDSTAWTGLGDALTKKHAGHRIAFGLVDSGGFPTANVYAFCSRFLILPCKGGVNKDFKRQLWITEPEQGVKLLNIETGYFKEHFYASVSIGTPDGRPPTAPLPGYCHFPIEYGEQHYRQLFSEEKVRERDRNNFWRSRWQQIHGRSNEQLDCRVYATAALHFLRDDEAKRLSKVGEEFSWEDFWTTLEGAKKPI